MAGAALAVGLCLSLVTCHLSPSAAEETRPLTLADCYTLALARSETIAIHQELIEQAEARFTQAFSGILPRLSFHSSDKRQEGRAGSQFALRKVPERKLSLTQPLFSGFKEFAAMAGVKAERRQRTAEKAHAELLLAVDVAEAFYLVLEQRGEAQALAMTEAALQERLEELKARERLGRSRASEVVSAQAQLWRLQAERDLVHQQELVARQLLEFLTGMEQLPPLYDPEPTLPPLDPEETYWTKAVLRPDVHAAEAASDAAGHEVKIAQADRWPDVRLDGNYYLERVGVSKDVSWDAALVVDVPIFEGGKTRGRVAEARSQANQATLRLSEARRRAVLEAQDAYAIFRTSRERAQALGRALDAADETYRLHVEDFRRSQVNILDVLQTLQTLEDIRREFIRATYEAKRQYWRLRAAAGEVPAP